ncbi:mannonate dehydratase [Marinomonas shanghaiensis]|jgi:mannonate dehydratase|uniref:mannonate dehydratase n=1 Tax=Marinomonas shanghaiensis TaxID=2202418 RepID=UPI000DB8FBDE|nr:mannonate dehydratase [Marinomonas shanghaiensis]
MEHTWRWFGPNDETTLTDIRQTGATGVVTALHEIPNGEVWPVEAIKARKEMIEAHSLRWSVVESVPVHEDIKKRTGNYQEYIQNYKQTLLNLAECGIDTVCYNFMPVLDWTRTDLDYELPDGSRALRFDQTAFAAFELYILERKGAENEYSAEEKAQAKVFLENLKPEDKDRLVANIIAGLPGSEESYTLEQFREKLDEYAGIDKDKLREHLKLFLEEIVPAAEQGGLRLAIHPDDPPRPILGLPRVVSVKDDIDWLVTSVPSPVNGITLCTGSYGVRADNDLVDMVNRFGSRIFFTHLRSTKREEVAGSFHEASHLGGDVDMVGVVRALLVEEKKRNDNNAPSLIPMRPDHGHQILNDLEKNTKPGYSKLGRMKGLAEVRGLELGLKSTL